MVINETEQILKEIREKAKGLLYFSEGKFPVEVFCCDTEETLRDHMVKISGRGHHETIEEVSLAFLYKNVNTLQEAQQPEINNTKKYIELINYLGERLSNLKVYKIGEDHIDVFISGSTSNGTYITLATKANE